MIEIPNEAFCPNQKLVAFMASVEGAGAIVSFSGLVRPSSSVDPVSNLLLQAHSPMTERGIEVAIRTAKSRWSLLGVSIVHRIGNIPPRDPIVFVATASDHRRAAFEAADFLMDYLKTEAVFWKKETRESGSTWVEPHARDYCDRDRWKQTQDKPS